MVDESLIRNTIAAGQLTKSTVRRMVSMISAAHEGGADAVMVTCSSIGSGGTPILSSPELAIVRAQGLLLPEAHLVVRS